MKALVLNAVGGGFDFEDVDVAAPLGREVLVEVRASEPCHTDLLFATQDFVPTPAGLGHEVAQAAFFGCGVVTGAGSVLNTAGVRAGDTVVDIPMYADLYLQGRMNLDDLVSKQIALREVNDGYAALKGGSLNRVVVTSF
jgi:Zn-dependent alcohol dehydrogenase